MISLLVINYRSSQLAVEAIRTARAASSEPLHVVVVDNSENASECDALRPHADVVIAAPRNLGYAGGINLGRRSCTGDILLVSNPDVRFAPSAIDILAAQLRAGANVAGPALYWDDAHTWILPPADLHTAKEELDRALAARSRAWARMSDKRRFLARVSFWNLAQPVEVRAVSGAVMAVRASAFDEAEGFDERFPLYFEETDFLRRVRGKIIYVPAARCRHLYNQSAGAAGDAASAKYAQSQEEYLRKWNGPAVASVLKSIRRRPAATTAQPIDGPIDIDRDDVVVEASPLPDFATAAGRFANRGTVELPDEVWSSYRGGTLYLRVADPRSGQVFATYARGRMPA